jgi:hypothetical protein
MVSVLGNFFATRMAPVAAALILSTAPASATVINGNFETGPFGTTPAGWTVSPGTEIVALKGSDYIPCCGTVGTAAQLANHFASFGPGNVANISMLSQIVSTVAGTSYTLSFDQGVLGGGSQTLFAQVFDAFGPTITAGNWTQTANNNLGATFITRTLTFVAPSASTRIEFKVDANSINVDGILDNVSLVGPVPEPSTWGLMLIGFGAVGAAMRRRQSGAASLI